jgi:hypothetical protein
MDFVLKNPNGTVGLFLRAGASRIVTAAKAQVGVRTGALQSSIMYTQERTAYGQKVRIGSSLGHALIHHEGVRPHRISGRDGGILRFSQRGRIVYDRTVMHPGSAPNKYLADNLPLIYTVSL